MTIRFRDSDLQWDVESYERTDYGPPIEARVFLDCDTIKALVSQSLEAVERDPYWNGLYRELKHHKFDPVIIERMLLAAHQMLPPSNPLGLR